MTLQSTKAQQHDVDGLQVREEGKVGEGGYSTIWCLGMDMARCKCRCMHVYMHFYNIYT